MKKVVIVIVCSIFISGCVYFDTYDNNNFFAGDSTAEERVIWLKKDKLARVCSEPSPDVAVSTLLKVYAEANDGTGRNAKIGTELASAIVRLGDRSIGVQMLRDWTYRMCEAWANGGIASQQYQRSLQAFPATLVAAHSIDALSFRSADMSNSVNIGSMTFTGSSTASIENGPTGFMDNVKINTTPIGTQAAIARTEAIKDIALNFFNYQSKVVEQEGCSSTFDFGIVTIDAIKQAIDCGRTVEDRTNVLKIANSINSDEVRTLYGKKRKKSKYNEKDKHGKYTSNGWSVVRIVKPVILEGVINQEQAKNDLHNLYPGSNIISSHLSHRMKYGNRGHVITTPLEIDNVIQLNAITISTSIDNNHFPYEVSENGSLGITITATIHDITKSIMYPKTNTLTISPQAEIGTLSITIAQSDTDTPTTKTYQVITPQTITITVSQKCPFNSDYTNYNSHQCSLDLSMNNANTSLKGDIARAVFYMHILYDLDINKVAYLDDICIWHKTDLPDAFEKRRDMIIKSYQGNHNPFVVKPELIDGLGICLNV